MPMTATIPTNTDYNTGWSVAALRNQEVFAIISLNVGRSSQITGEMARNATYDVLNMQTVKDAIEAADSYWLSIDDADDSEKAEAEWDRMDVTVRFGMASGGEFSHNFSKAEAKRAGINHI